MQVRSYIDDLEDKNALDKEEVKVLSDGRRVKERVRSNRSDDGSEEHTHEILEEVVPMRVSKVVRRKVRPVEVEERVEQIAEDGTVTTNVRSIDPHLLDMDREPTSLERISSDLHLLKSRLMGENASVTKKRLVKDKKGKSRSFLNRAKLKFSNAKEVEDELVDDGFVKEDQDTEEAPSKASEYWLTALAWVTFAVVAALVTYTLI